MGIWWIWWCLSNAATCHFPRIFRAVSTYVHIFSHSFPWESEVVLYVTILSHSFPTFSIIFPSNLWLFPQVFGSNSVIQRWPEPFCCASKLPATSKLCSVRCCRCCRHPCAVPSRRKVWDGKGKVRWSADLEKHLKLVQNWDMAVGQNPVPL